MARTPQFPFSINITEKEIASFLTATEFFGNLSEEELLEISPKFEVIYINSGEVVVKQGEEGDCLFLVVSGRLRTVKQAPSAKEEFILNEISNGELIGELALLVNEPRAATVTAIRDCILLKLSRQAFESFIANHPLQMMPIVRSTITRLLTSSKKPYYPISTIAVAPACDSENFSEFAALFAKELSKYGATLHLDQATSEKLMAQENIDLNLQQDKNLAISSWLNAQASKYSYIVYETDRHYSPWTRRCLRQADRIVLVCNAKNNLSHGDIENEIFQTMTTKNIDMVFIHDNAEQPQGTQNWLKLRKINLYHHIRKNNLDDLHRFIRIITGRSVSLILGGGGARALTYIGVYKALIELGIPIDLIGGTSFGGLIGGGIALDLSPEMIAEKIKKYIIDNKKIFSYTIPLLSLNSGAGITAGAKAAFGEQTYIEDTWRKFFCIACNLNTGNTVTLDSGLLWKAIRATVSLPMVFPPISNEFGELLIDGGLLNNLPVDIMRRIDKTGQIIAVTTPLLNKKGVNIPEGVMSGWSLLRDKIFSRTPSSYPTIYEIILNSIGISGMQHQQSMVTEANFMIKIQTKDISILDFKAIDKLIQIGYFTTMEKLSRHRFTEIYLRT